MEGPFDEHLNWLDAVLQKLGQANLKMKPAKCHLFADQVQYLGHVISAEGVAIDPAKTEAVHVWPEPINVREQVLSLEVWDFGTEAQAHEGTLGTNLVEDELDKQPVDGATTVEVAPPELLRPSPGSATLKQSRPLPRSRVYGQQQTEGSPRVPVAWWLQTQRRHSLMQGVAPLMLNRLSHLEL
ncbi:hypothetical protein SRHO_G00023710 [Serrasalmus rhombeus]